MIYDNILDITTVDLSTIFFSKFVRVVQRNNVNNFSTNPCYIFFIDYNSFVKNYIPYKMEYTCRMKWNRHVIYKFEFLCFESVDIWKILIFDVWQNFLVYLYFHRGNYTYFRLCWTRVEFLYLHPIHLSWWCCINIFNLFVFNKKIENVRTNNQRYVIFT